MKDLSKHFQNEIKTASIENFSAKIKPPYFLPSIIFPFIMCLPRNSILFYAFITSIMLEKLREVSAQIILCKSSHHDCLNVEIFILESQETFPGTFKVNMMNVLYFFVIYRLYLDYNAKLTVEPKVINYRHKI